MAAIARGRASSVWRRAGGVGRGDRRRHRVDLPV